MQLHCRVKLLNMNKNFWNVIATVEINYIAGIGLKKHLLFYFVAIKYDNTATYFTIQSLKISTRWINPYSDTKWGCG